MPRPALFVVVLLTAACAARQPAPAPVPAAPSVDVEALVRQGCYRCLEEAFEAVKGRNSQQAFEIALLLAARSKELGLPHDPWLVEAQTDLPLVPDWATYLEIVTAQQVDPLSGDRDQLLAQTLQRRLTRTDFDGWRAVLGGGPGSPLLRAYLDLIVVCRTEFGPARATPEERDAAVAAIVRQFGTTPLIQYRVGLCGGGEFEQLATVREAHRELVDADLELGRRALQNRVPPDVGEGLARLRSAKDAFPASPVVPATIGDLHQTREEWPEALAEYEAALAIVPTHRDALLGRTVSLSQLERYEEALATAITLIELRNWFIGPAYFWKAWNEYQLNMIREAREDADRAKPLMVNPALSVLSGMIEWRERRLESAEAEFQRAIELDFGQCDAAFYLGSVRWERRMWPESLAAFQHAVQCFELSVVTRREALAKLGPTPELAAQNARQMAAHEDAIGVAQKRRGEAEQNVASLKKLVGGTVQ
ncbi:MAG: tetratricopeptide repeat protein [Acidimicrobiia bacterium]|nr:tetratricopeptide repeat protein [Acidimicrobiia bacterium]